MTREEALFAIGVNLANDAATAQIAHTMRARHVRAIVLKGPATRHWLYGAAAPRLSMDVDLLLSWGDLEEAERALRSLGCRYLGVDAVGPDRPHCRVWELPGSGTMLELHRRIAGIGVPSDVAWDVLSENTESMEVAGTQVDVLSAPARALHLALHAAQHGAKSEQTRADLALALERLSEETWTEAASLADRLDALPAFGAGLRLVPEGTRLLAGLTVRDVPVEVALRASSSPPMAEGLDWMSRLPLRKKAVFMLRHLVPPAGYMRIWFPLARRSKAGLVLAYAWRPAWLLAHLPAAVMARRAARKPRG